MHCVILNWNHEQNLNEFWGLDSSNVNVNVLILRVKFGLCRKIGIEKSYWHRYAIVVTCLEDGWAPWAPHTHKPKLQSVPLLPWVWPGLWWLWSTDHYQRHAGWLLRLGPKKTCSCLCLLEHFPKREGNCCARRLCTLKPLCYEEAQAAARRGWCPLAVTAWGSPSKNCPTEPNRPRILKYNNRLLF